MRIVAIIAARMGSARFPGKMMLPLIDRPCLAWTVDAAMQAKLVEDVWVATTTEIRDNTIADWCLKNGVMCWRGSEFDVLQRFTDCALDAGAGAIVRLTGDCVFADPWVIDQTITLFRRSGCDYAQNVSPATWPDGLDCEVVKTSVLQQACREAKTATDRETVTQFIERNRDRWKSEPLICPIPGLEKERWVLDTAEDYEFCKKVARRLSGRPTMIGILDVLHRHPELREINAKWKRNERFFAALSAE